jgi:hypothetical protein
MKTFLLSILILTVVAASCSKPAASGKHSSGEFTGRWRYAERFYSIGGPLIYESTEGLKQWIEFKADGGFASNMPEFKDATSYKTIDPSKVQLIRPLQQPNTRLYFITLDSTGGSLSLSPADFVCIEGCGVKFKR